jgi:hypothetical protein
MKRNLRFLVLGLFFTLVATLTTQIWAQPTTATTPTTRTAPTTPTTGTTPTTATTPTTRNTPTATTPSNGATTATATTPTTPNTPTGTTPSNGATATTETTPTTGTLGAALTAEAVIQQIVEITSAVPAGAAAVTAYTVPAGSRLVVTDVVVTNTGASATCTLSIARGTGPVTGPLCIPARTTLTVSLTTGLEFAPGETVQLARPPEADAPATSTDTVSVHMRGFLAAAG